MPTSIYQTARASLPSSGIKTQPPGVCPTCGGPECLCRPRFFAGQLLTDEDLTRLDRYILEKNKLHNRHLHGWGVVCGLEVVCHSCEDMVIVKPGYALGPCGEDIVVCGDAPVAVCELIRNCREKEHEQAACEPYRPRATEGDCKDVCQDWVLFIRYDEKPTRGVTALRGAADSACCSRCSGGSSAACGCSCHEKKNGNGYRAPARKASAQCEPTVICETYRFEVGKLLPAESGSGRIKAGSRLSGRSLTHLSDEFTACLTSVADQVPPQPDLQTAVAADWHRWCCEVKAGLSEFLRTHATYDCQLDDRLNAVACPALEIATQETANDAFAEMVAIVSELVSDCACSLLLPSCPAPVTDSRVPLATITVCGPECRLMSVCNVDVRKHVITFPLLQHFLSSLGLEEVLRARLASLCCDGAQPTSQPTVAGFGRRPLSMPPSRAVPAGDTLFSRLAARRQPETSVRTLLLGVIGARDAAGQPLASSLELRDPFQTLVVDKLVRPVLGSLIPAEVARRLRAFVAPATTAAAEEEAIAEEEVARMKGELEELRKVALDQQVRIDELMKKMQ